MSTTIEPSNPFAAAPIAAAPQHASGQALVAREVGEVQAALVMAKRFPRDERAAVDRILTACGRQKLAESAVYEYARGGQAVTGPSIRLAEVLAVCWGNMLQGVVELSRQNGVSECLAFAWDLETNTRDEKRFQVKHWRDKKNGGGYALTDERDIYELIANMGARRKRACILSIIPGDVQESALDQCDLTLKAKVDVGPESIKRTLGAFEKYGVTASMIEKRIQRRLDSITPGIMLQLIRIGTSLKDGMSLASEWFEMDPTDGGAGSGAPASRTDQVKEALKKAAPVAPPAEANEAEPAPHETTDPADAAAGPAEAGTASTETDEERESRETKEKLEASIELSVRIVAAAKASQTQWSPKSRKVLVPPDIASALGIAPGDHGALPLVEQGHGPEILNWLESCATPDGDAA